MAAFQYQELFEHGADKTPYRQLTSALRNNRRFWRPRDIAGVARGADADRP